MLQKKRQILNPTAICLGIAALGLLGSARAEEQPSSYAPVNITENFTSTMARMKAAKAQVMQRQEALLEERYDLSDRPAEGVTMTGGKALQDGVRRSRAGVWCVSNATRTGTPTPALIWWATSGLRSFAIASIRRPCEGSISSACSGLSERSRAWRTSPSSSNAPPTSTVIR